MYSERDIAQARGRLRRCIVALAVALLAILALYAFALARRVQWLAYVAAALLAVAACYGLLAKVVPCQRYLRFLTEVGEGGRHEFEGTLTRVSAQREPQDGAMVLPVHLLLDAEQDERTYYLNASKAEGFPAPGAHVRLRCFGRHIVQAEALPDANPPESGT